MSDIQMLSDFHEGEPMHVDNSDDNDDFFSADENEAPDTLSNRNELTKLRRDVTQMLQQLQVLQQQKTEELRTYEQGRLLEQEKQLQALREELELTQRQQEQDRQVQRQEKQDFIAMMEEQKVATTRIPTAPLVS